MAAGGTVMVRLVQFSETTLAETTPVDVCALASSEAGVQAARTSGGGAAGSGARSNRALVARLSLVSGVGPVYAEGREDSGSRDPEDTAEGTEERE